MTNDAEQINAQLLDALQNLVDWITMGPVKYDDELFGEPVGQAEAAIAQAKENLRQS